MGKLSKSCPRFKTTREMRTEFDKLTSCWSNESILNTRMLLWLCEFFERQAPASKQKKPLSSWQKFFAASVRKGKTAQQAAQEWKKQKLSK